MKKPSEIISERINNRKEEDDPEKMDFMMRTIKAVHSSANTVVTQEELEHHRQSADTFSRLITPVSSVMERLFEVDEVNCEQVSPKFAHRMDKIILYCHGGGYISGGLKYAGVLAAKLALHTGLEVVTFEYRLAPEHPYPAAIDDAEKVWNHLMQVGYGAKDIIIAGDSAGGNLALELCLRLKAQERMLPRAMVLMSPWTDMTCESTSYKTYVDKDPMLTYEYVVASREAYAGTDADYKDPNLSPLFADLDRMPPALVQVGSNEILRDDSEKLVKKLRKQESLARLEIYPGGWHVFQQMPIPKATKALDQVKVFLDDIL